MLFKPTQKGWVSKNYSSSFQFYLDIRSWTISKKYSCTRSKNFCEHCFIQFNFPRRYTITKHHELVLIQNVPSLPISLICFRLKKRAPKIKEPTCRNNGDGDQLEHQPISYDAASGSDNTPCIKIDKPLVVYRFSNVT